MTDIVSVLNLINYGFVLIFGIIVSFYFAGIQWEDNKRLFILTTVLFVLFQALFYVLLGENVLFKCYPVLIHIPLILIIRYICHQNIYISFIAVMSAYLMCTPRKWFGTLAKYIFPEIPVISDVVTIVITIPLLIVVIKYISPYIIKLKEESKNIISMFFLLPLTYYILEYALTVYTNLLYTGKAVIIEFMDSFIVVLYFFLSIVTLSMSNKKNTAERENIILSAAAAQAEKDKMEENDIPIPLTPANTDVTSFLAKQAVRATNLMPIRAIITDSFSGLTARNLAAFRGKYPVLAICYKEKTMRHLALSYGVEAIYMPEKANGQEYYFAALRKLMDDGVLSENEMVAYLSGGKQGTHTSFLEINQVGDVLKSGDDYVLPNRNRYL